MTKTLSEVKQMILDLLFKYQDKFPTTNWTIRYSNRQRRALATTRQYLRMDIGSCTYKVWRIEFVFNNKYINANLDRIESIRRTVLHEIAHAIVGGGHGHDRVWACCCRELGIEPKRCVRRGEDFNYWE